MSGGFRARSMRTLLAVACSGLASAACAQTPKTVLPAKTSPASPAAVAPPPKPDAPPPYEPDLLKLAELMGTLDYLRDLCGDGDAGQWRDRMTALLTAEGKTAERKDRLAGAFNRGFRGYELIYRTCTAAAHVVIDRALDEAGRLARTLDSQYGG